ncbi:MAG: hypothetical protein HY704_11470 [Gemmatimonadetes bacterium]|nr:hypothetical protein [Gemmatimonadota bacterium]
MTEVEAVDSDREEDGRISPVVALALLEVMRAQDLPDEVLAEEDLTETLPRRLGLNDVIDASIRRYRKGAGRLRRVRAGEIRDLIQLVLRRPDCRDLFYRAGRRLAGDPSPSARVVRALPQRAAVAVARRRSRARVARLLGRPAPLAEGDLFGLVGRDLITARSDPSGQACALLTGLFDELLERYTGQPLRAVHEECEALGQSRCAWTLAAGAEGAG